MVDHARHSNAEQWPPGCPTTHIGHRAIISGLVAFPIATEPTTAITGLQDKGTPEPQTGINRTGLRKARIVVTHRLEPHMPGRRWRPTTASRRKQAGRKLTAVQKMDTVQASTARLPAATQPGRAMPTVGHNRLTARRQQAFSSAEISPSAQPAHLKAGVSRARQVSSQSPEASISSEAVTSPRVSAAKRSSAANTQTAVVTAAANITAKIELLSYSSPI